MNNTLDQRLSKFLKKLSASWSSWQRKCEYLSKSKSSISSKQWDSNCWNIFIWLICKWLLLAIHNPKYSRSQGLELSGYKILPLFSEFSWNGWDWTKTLVEQQLDIAICFWSKTLSRGKELSFSIFGCQQINPENGTVWQQLSLVQLSKLKKSNDLTVRDGGYSLPSCLSFF